MCVCSAYSAELISNAAHHTDFPLMSPRQLSLANAYVGLSQKLTFRLYFKETVQALAEFRSSGGSSSSSPHRSRPPPVLQCYKSLSRRGAHHQLSLMSVGGIAVLDFRNLAALTLSRC